MDISDWTGLHVLHRFREDSDWTGLHVLHRFRERERWKAGLHVLHRLGYMKCCCVHFLVSCGGFEFEQGRRN